MKQVAASSAARPAKPVQGTFAINVPRYKRARTPRLRTTVPDPTIGELVLDFHRAFQLPRNAEPTLDVSTETAGLRLRLLAEESAELAAAIQDSNLVAIADALADITYVVFGTAITYGIDLEAVVREVHRSNMSKLDAQGKPVMRSDGKVLKSTNYAPPDVGTVLALQPPLF